MFLNTVYYLIQGGIVSMINATQEVMQNSYGGLNINGEKNNRIPGENQILIV